MDVFVLDFGREEAESKIEVLPHQCYLRGPGSRSGVGPPGVYL